jgi:L,D-peptidoglycan transpeptidase YkuD (ErfK/YbiS/YcfS/YnhG family)
MDIVVSRKGAVHFADWGTGERRAAIGWGGVGEKTREGDGVTPVGIWPVRRVFYRPDRVTRPDTILPIEALSPDSGWCDAPGDPNYNRFVRLPYAASAERMWREDRLYDIVAVLGFNDAPVAPGKGSAIFLHVAAPDYSGTQGCVALAPDDLRQALAQLRPGDKVIVKA